MNLEKGKSEGKFFFHSEPRFIKRILHPDVFGAPDIGILITFSPLLNAYLASRDFRYPWSVPKMKAGVFDMSGPKLHLEAVAPNDLEITQLPEGPRDRVLVSNMADIHLMTASCFGQEALLLFKGFKGRLPLEGFLGARNPLYSLNYWQDLITGNGEVFSLLIPTNESEEKFNHHLSALRREAEQAKTGLEALPTVIDHGDFQEKNICLARPYDPKVKEVPPIFIFDWDGVRENYAWAAILWFLMTACSQSEVSAGFNPKRAKRILELVIQEMETRPVSTDLKNLWNPIPSPPLASFLLKVNCLRAAYTSYSRATQGGHDEPDRWWRLLNLNLEILDFLEEEGEKFFRGLGREIPRLRPWAEITETIAVDIFKKA